MAEPIQAVPPGVFPYSRRSREKNTFARWVDIHAANVLDDGPVEMPLLSLEDELTLARLRELPWPMPMRNPYVPVRGKGGALVDQDGQYLFSFMARPVNEFFDEEV